MKTTFTQSRQGGFTLLELLLVIGVAALLLIGGIATYRLVSEGNRATEATRLLLTLRQEAQTFAQQQGGSYNGVAFDSTASDTNNPFVAAGVLRNQQRTPFNTNILIASGGASNDRLIITFSAVPRASCVKLFTAINNPNEIESVQAGTGGARPANADPAQITAINAATDCSAAANDITWMLM